MTDMPLHDILMITYNRPGYTARALDRLLGSCDERMRVWVWHNGTDAPTIEVVEARRGHPRMHHVEMCPENKKLREPTNWFWAHADGAYLSKVDDDCLVPDGWSQTLIAALEANPDLGVIGTWRFYDEDFVSELAMRKIVSLRGGHQMMANCWVQGSGYVMRRDVVEGLGPLRPEQSFGRWCIAAALAGWRIGWYYPFLHEEHMDDPASPFCEIKSDADFLANRPLSAVQDDVRTLAQWAARERHMAYLVQKASADPRRYAGWRRRVDGVIRRARAAIGVREVWR